MRVIETAVYRGPHVWSMTPMVRVMLALGELEQYPTDTLPGFAEALRAHVPALADHGCSGARPGGFLERLEQGTWMGHVVEHVALALQASIGARVSRGKTRSVRGRPGVYNVLFAYEDADVALTAGAVALQLVTSLLPGHLQELHLGRLASRAPAEEGERIPGRAALQRIAEQRRPGPTTQHLADAARSRGIPVYRPAGSNLLRLGWGSHQHVLSASLTDRTSHLAVELARNKQRTREVLATAGVPVPRGAVVRTADAAIVAASRIGSPVVTKPVDGNHGRGVTVGVLGDAAVRHGFEVAATHGPKVIVEQQLLGRDYRVLVVDGRVVAVAERIPARVIGDGQHSVAELVDAANADPRRGYGHRSPLTRITLDPAVDRLLAAQGMDRGSVPAPRVEVWLRETANLSSGGEAVDRTDEVHPDNAAMLTRAAQVVGLDVAGIDLITPDIARPLREVGGGIIEVNAAPGFRMHVHPSQGEPKDVGRAVIDMLYPRGTRARIPVIAVTGTNGKSTTVRMLAHLLRAPDRRIGITTTTGVHIDDVTIKPGDASGPRSARMLLDDPTVDVAILETARGGILREGLAVDRLKVGIFLNVSADHLGLGGVHTVRELARVKSVVLRAVERRGLSILNADDPVVVRHTMIAGGRIGYVTLKPLDDRVQAAVRAGGLVGALEADGMLVIHDAGYRMPLLHAAEIPAAVGGAARFNVQNALAAALAAHFLGVGIAEIATRLHVLAAGDSYDLTTRIPTGHAGPSQPLTPTSKEKRP